MLIQLLDGDWFDVRKITAIRVLPKSQNFGERVYIQFGDEPVILTTENPRAYADELAHKVNKACGPQS